LPLVTDFLIHNRDLFGGNGGDKAAREAFDKGHSHFIEFVEPAIDIDWSILICANDVVNNVF
jgi:hypothetical protein